MNDDQKHHKGQVIAKDLDISWFRSLRELTRRSCGLKEIRIGLRWGIHIVIGILQGGLKSCLGQKCSSSEKQRGKRSPQGLWKRSHIKSSRLRKYKNYYLNLEPNSSKINKPKLWIFKFGKYERNFYNKKKNLLMLFWEKSFAWDTKRKRNSFVINS